LKILVYLLYVTEVLIIVGYVYKAFVLLGFVLLNLVSLLSSPSTLWWTFLIFCGNIELKLWWHYFVAI